MRVLSRRRLAVAALLLASATSIVASRVQELALHHTSLISGLVLLLLVVALVALNVRKKLPFFPILSSAAWMQLHLYAGLFAVVIYGIHTGLRVPNGGLEVTLAALFWIVAVSGLIGLFLTRVIPRRLRTRGDPVIHERYPMLLRQLRHELAAQMAAAPDSPALADFYARRLVRFFARPRNGWEHLWGSERTRTGLLRELDAQGRYLNDRETAVRLAIAKLIATKSDLDYHHAHQATLKYWLFVHIPASYSLVIAGVVHGWVAYAWSGGG